MAVTADWGKFMARRGRLVMLSVAVAAATAFAALPGQAETMRTGLARAQLARIVPYVGIPSVGAGAGVAQAEVSGGSAHASAGLADFGGDVADPRRGGLQVALPPPRSARPDHRRRPRPPRRRAQP